MKRVVLVLLGVLVSLALIALVVDRVAAVVAERTITSAVQDELAGAGSVTTSVGGVPLLTQAIGGSLDHVTVTVDDLEAGGLVLDSVVVDLIDVTVAEPRTAREVEAHASITSEALAAKLGDGWDLRTEGGLVVVSGSGGLPLEARATPVVRDGVLVLDLDSVSVLGITVDGADVPAFLTERLNELVSSASALPLGLRPAEVAVTGTGIDLVARGTAVVLSGS